MVVVKYIDNVVRFSIDSYHVTETVLIFFLKALLMRAYVFTFVTPNYSK